MNNNTSKETKPYYIYPDKAKVVKQIKEIQELPEDIVEKLLDAAGKLYDSGFYERVKYASKNA